MRKTIIKSLRGIGSLLLASVACATALLAGEADPNALAARSYDVLVIEGTAGGVACAVRAAREGLSVLVVNRTKHLGGMLTNGLCQWDALYDGTRAPIFREYARMIEEHYRTTYGEDSNEYLRHGKFSKQRYPLGRFEPSVAERQIDRLVGAEARITVLRGYYPVGVERDGRLIRSVRLRSYPAAAYPSPPTPLPQGERGELRSTPFSQGERGESRSPPLPQGERGELSVTAKVFVDASYEGDLLALAKVPYRVGREGRDEYKEPHAGKVFTNIASEPAPKDAVEGRLNIYPYRSSQGAIDPSSTGEADRAVQAYNYRHCITNDPENRVLPEKPAGYNREEYVHYDRKSMGGAGPNHKTTFNSPILPGENYDYPEADWPTREKIIRRHLNFALGLMYFLQNDESVPEKQRRAFRQWGLPKDEYVDNNHVPYEMYVRESRRLVGRYVYTEHDNSLAPGLARTPVHADSVAITDWYMDSHACSKESRPGYRYDGKLILTEESRPGQVPYRTMLPQGVDNLLVPVCLSATHIAWGAIRLEPVCMQTGEAAGFAAAMAIRGGTTPGAIDADALVRTLVERGLMVSFFNDVDVADKRPWVKAVQYLGTRGFFDSYDGRPKETLTEPVAVRWAATLAAMLEGKSDPTGEAKKLHAMDESGRAITLPEFADLLAAELTRVGVQAGRVQKAVDAMKLDRRAPVTRGDACRLLYELSRAETGTGTLHAAQERVPTHNIREPVPVSAQRLKPLFDGKAFNGWEGNREIFRIEDGAIVGGSLKAPVPRNEYLCTTRQYGNFELRLKFKVLSAKPDGPIPNAGIQFRSERVPNSNEMIGYQADIGIGLGRNLVGWLYDERRHKLLAGPEAKTQENLFQPDGWNQYVIRAEGLRIQLWLNGRQTVDYTEPDPSIPQTGVIGLQIHVGAPAEAWYKDIQIRELPHQGEPR